MVLLVVVAAVVLLFLLLLPEPDVFRESAGKLATCFLERSENRESSTRTIS